MGSTPPKIYKIIINITVDSKTGKIITNQELENGAPLPSNPSIIINNDNKNDNIFSLFNSANLKYIMKNEDDINNQKNENYENNNNNDIRDINNNDPIIDINNNNNNNNNEYNKKENEVKTDFGKDEEEEKKENEVKTDFGKDEEEEKKESIPPTPNSIFTNGGFFNNNEQKEEDKKETDKGEDCDMNQGSHYQKELKKGNFMDFNYNMDDLEISQSVVFFQGNNYLEQTQNMIEKGYYPLFIKLDNHDPLFFGIKGESPLRSLIKAYIKNMPQTDEGIIDNIKLYSGDKPLDLDKQIKNLELEELSIITNKKNEEIKK